MEQGKSNSEFIPGEAHYAELLKSREELEARLASARKELAPKVIAKMRTLVEEYALTPRDLFPDAALATQVRAPRSNRSKGRPKYKDPVTGKTWTGRGKAPGWMAGKPRDHFLITP